MSLRYFLHLSAYLFERGILVAFICGSEKDRDQSSCFQKLRQRHDFVGRVFKALFAAIVVVVVIFGPKKRHVDLIQSTGSKVDSHGERYI